MNKEEDPKYLMKRIAELERTVAMQDRLISILREMPGCKQVGLPEESKRDKDAKVQTRTNSKDRSVASGRKKKATTGRVSKKSGDHAENS